MKKRGNKSYRQFSAPPAAVGPAMTRIELTAASVRHYLTLDLIFKGAGQAAEFLTIAELLNLTAVLAAMGYCQAEADALGTAQEAFSACIEAALDTGAWVIDQPTYAHLCLAVDTHYRQLADASMADLLAAQRQIGRHLAAERSLESMV